MFTHTQPAGRMPRLRTLTSLFLTLLLLASTLIMATPAGAVPTSLGSLEFHTDEDQEFTIDVSEFFEDTLPLSYAIASFDSLNGSFSHLGDGLFSYEPHPNFHGTDSLDIRVCNSDFECVDDTIVVYVAAVNDAPEGKAASATFNEDQIVSFPASFFVSDVDDAPETLSYTLMAGPQHGILILEGPAAWRYIPAANFHGTDIFTFSVCDPSGACDTALITFTIGSVNDSPSATGIEVETAEDTPLDIDLAALVSDPDHDIEDLTLFIIEAPGRGEISSAGNGTWTYAPDPHYWGWDTFTYKVCDPEGACDTGDVGVTMTAVNDRPSAKLIVLNVEEDIPVEVGVDELASDVDDPSESLTITLNVAPDFGSFINNGDGTWTYTPNKNYHGVDHMFYTVCDADGACDSRATFISIASINDSPETTDLYVETDEDTPIDGIDIASMFFDVDGNLRESPTLEQHPSHGSLTGSTENTRYTPDPDFYGSDSAQLTWCDLHNECATGTVFLTVNPVNDAPVADIGFEATDEDTEVVVDMANLVSDIDDDVEDLSITVSGAPDYGSIVVNGDNTWTYVPGADYNGPDSFEFEVCDPDEACDSGSVTILVAAMNDAPTAADGTTTLDEDETVVIDLKALVSDVDDAVGDLIISISVDPGHGGVAANGDGTWSYTPAVDYNGADSFTYEVCDSEALCDTGEVVITVNEVNDVPQLADQTVETGSREAVAVEVAVKVVDPDDTTHEVTVTRLPANGTAVVDGDGKVVYTPEEWFAGEDSFEVSATDDDGAVAIAVITVTVAPTAEPISKVAHGELSENDSYTYQLIHPNGGHTLSWPHSSMGAMLLSTHATPEGFTFTVDGAPSFGALTFGDTTVVYTPDHYYNGTDAFSVLVCADTGVCELHSLLVVVTAVADAPWVINPDDTNTVPGQPAELVETIAVGERPADLVVFNPDEGPYTITLTGGALPTGVTLNPDGSFTGVATIPGRYEASIEVCNADAGLCSTIVLNITVTGDNDFADTDEELPRTGTDTSRAGGAAAILALLGALMLFLANRAAINSRS